MAVYSPPGSSDSTIEVKEQYDNFIGGEWVAPVDGEYFDNITPVTGEVFCQVARGKEVSIPLCASHFQILRLITWISKYIVMGNTSRKGFAMDLDRERRTHHG